VSGNPHGHLPYDAGLDAYEHEAASLFAALEAQDAAAEWRVKWEHPRFRGRDVADVRRGPVRTDDARMVVAREYGFEAWPQLAAFAERIAHDEGLRCFEAAVDAVVSGDERALAVMLREHPMLARERSARRHHATLLHYVAANGAEGARQRTPPNAVAVATMLLDAGAEPDALADMYDHRCTTLSMLVSSSPPAAAGLQLALAELLLDRGASPRGPGTAWQSAVLTALIFGFRDTALALSRRKGGATSLVEAAGLGSAVEVARLLPGAAAHDRHAALALAAQHGHASVVGMLLDAGENPDRFNPEGFHAHATPLHHAAAGDHLDVVRLLAERGARLDIRDAIYHATPLGWAEHGRCARTAEYLRQRGAPR
jgi:hypothetical protein